MYTKLNKGYRPAGMPYNYCTFLCDTKEDLNTLPTNTNNACAIGSQTIVASEQMIYILNNANKWVEYRSTKGES